MKGAFLQHARTVTVISPLVVLRQKNTVNGRGICPTGAIREDRRLLKQQKSAKRKTLKANKIKGLCKKTIF